MKVLSKGQKIRSKNIKVLWKNESLVKKKYRIKVLPKNKGLA
jgi:hypothetical protein